MRPLLVLLTFAVVFSVVLLGLAQLASAGSPETPELTDAEGDCAVPYGNLYLDIASAWIDTETTDTFDVHLKLAGFESEVAEGAGYAVQFHHQGTQWGIVAVYSAVLAEGWSFSTGMATAELAEGFEDAPGSFDEATATISVTFAKSLFSHVDMNDSLVGDFVAMTADLRPAMPFFLGGDTGVPLDGNGRWVLCDEAQGTGTYTLGMSHGGEHAMHTASTPEAAAQEDGPIGAAAAGPEPEATTEDAPAKTPFVTLPLLALALAVALVLTSRRR